MPELPSNELNDLLQRCFALDGDNNVALRVIFAGLGADAVKDYNIDWGFDTDQVGADDVPVDDAGDYFTSTNVEDILQEIGEALGSAGAPNNATYITQVPSGGLDNEQALSLLSTGLMKSTTATGEISIAVEGTDYWAPGGTDVAVADGGTGASSASGARTNLGAAASALTLTAGGGLTGGGDLTANRTFALDITGQSADASPDGAADYVITWDASASAFKKVLLNNLPSSGGGEANTASNVGTGQGLWKQKTGVDLEFYSILAGSDRIIVDLASDDVTIDVDEAELDLANMGGLLPVALGGTNATTAANARTNLGLAIGTNVQAYDATLASIASLGTAADKVAYTTGVDTWAETALTSFGRSLIDDADASTARTTLGLVIGTNVQAYDAELAAIAGLTSAADKLPYFTGSGTADLADFTSFGRSLVDDADASAARTTLGLVIGTNVQAYDADLDALAGLSSTGMIARTGSGTAAARTITGTSNQVIVADGNGVSGNPTLSLPQSIHTSGTPQFARLGLGIAADGTAVLNLASGANILVNSANAKRTLILSAAGGWASTTNGCAAATKVETSSNKVNYYVLDFSDSGGKLYAEWQVLMPANWDGGTVTAKFVWTGNSTSTNAAVWGLQGVAFGDATAIDAAFGTAQEVSDALDGTANHVAISAATSAITIAGSPAGGKHVQFRAYRDSGNGSDTLAATARLLEVHITYGISSYSDS